MMWKIIMAILFLIIGLLAIIGCATLYIIIVTIQDEREFAERKNKSR